MGEMRTVSLYFILLTMSLSAGCSADSGSVPVSVHWHAGEKTPDGAMFAEKFTVTNISDEDLPAGWEIWFNQFGRRIVQREDVPVRVEMVNGTLFKIYPSEYYRPLKPGEVLEIPFSTNFRFHKNRSAPEGMFMVTTDGQTLPVEVTFDRLPPPNDGRHIYTRNTDAGEWTAVRNDIIPAPKKLIPHDGTTEISHHIAIRFPEKFENEARLLGEKLSRYWNARISDKGSTEIIFAEMTDPLTDQKAEGYELVINEGAVYIHASDPAGAFYGAQTLLAMLKGEELPCVLRNESVSDWPDFVYRGQHIDIARNYTTKDNLLRLLDIFASYKLNTFHFHFSDDEGWRIEIPGLPELTEVGGRRGYTADERDMLVPAYCGGADPAKGSGSGFLTRVDFIELLRYAGERHIQVIPEIESPAHARAAIVAMNSRYHKYMDTDPVGAREYLLADFGDGSLYWSAQDYSDNVMNVALPSTYRFIEKVIDEIAAMYREAGVPLHTVHIGGDEVPRGSWTASPVAAAFMEENGIPDAAALGEYYILRVNDLLKARGLKMAGWQELVEGRSSGFREAIRDNIGWVNCWNTGGDAARVTYELANLGYPVVLSNLTNFYLDLAYNPHPDEPGHWWAGFIDDQRSFSMQPFDIYASVRRDDYGYPVDYASAGEGMQRLTPEGTTGILGVQGQLWAETVRDFDMVEYYMFPKIYGLMERAWNARPDWSASVDERRAFLDDYARFNATVTQREMPWLDRIGVRFRLPQPGIYVEGGMLYANSPISGGEIRYTVDGSEPTGRSRLWTKPVECGEVQVRARVFYLGRQSVTSRWEPSDSAVVMNQNSD